MSSEGLFGIGDGSADLAAIRALRADPPGCATDGRRRKTFNAALEQFEQLHSAARGEGVASAPIPLFYALAQAGRAILAAHAPKPWEVRGHGLSVHAQGSDIGATAITPNGEGLFQAVASATGSDPLTQGMTLSETRARIPHVPRSVDLEPGGPMLFTVEYLAVISGRVVLDEHGAMPNPAEIFISRRDAFPQLANAKIDVRNQDFITVDFPSEAEAVAFDASLWPYLDRRYLRLDQAPSGLMMWWMLIQALSALARYEPAMWTAAIAPDRSRVAVPLEQTLQTAAMILPRLVCDALTLNTERL